MRKIKEKEEEKEDEEDKKKRIELEEDEYAIMHFNLTLLTFKTYHESGFLIPTFAIVIIKSSSH